MLLGEEVYKFTCFVCHAAGVAGAPKVGDATAWEPRLADDYDKVVGYALQSLRGMPAKDGNPSLDDIEVTRAVVYMANKSGGTFKEPAVPAPAALAAVSASAPAFAASIATESAEK